MTVYKPVTAISDDGNIIGDAYIPIDETDVEYAYWAGISAVNKGGPESGFHGHAGRPGLVGGSSKAVTQTEAFKKWFGNSKVVDENGNPLVVYHGTTSDFTMFDVSKLGANADHPSATLGFFFAKDPELANDFAGQERTGGKVIPVYLKMENPYYMEAKDWADDLDFWKGVRGAIGGHGVSYDDSVDHYGKMYDWLDSKGYDGLIIKGSEDNGGYPELLQDNYVVFHSNQIKSAIGNKGTFDPEDWDITKEIVEKQLPIDEASRANLISIRTGIFYSDVDRLSERMYTGEISIGQWEESMKKEIRELHSSVAAIGKGGWENMTSADWGRLGTPVREQYKFLHGFANDISEQRDTISIDAIKARAHLYGNAAGHSAALMVAGPIANMLPWMPKDGSTECLVNCKCEWRLKVLEKRKDFSVVQAVWTLNPAEHCLDCVDREGHTVILQVPADVPVPSVITGY